MKIRLLVLLLLSVIATTGLHAAPPKKPATDASIQQAVNDLNQYAELQKSLNTQNPDLAYAMRKALVIANLVLDANGKLRTDLVSKIKSAFIPAKPQEYEVNMARFLDNLDVSWQPFFDQVTLSTDPNCVSNTSLRALFSLGQEQKLSDRHAKVAVLTAMLSPYNQGPVGDCFAVNVVIRDHTEYYRHIAEDSSSIIMNGYLQRPVNNATDYFFYLPIMADDDRDQFFNLTIEGIFPGTNKAIFDAPGFAAARALMGGNSISSLPEEVLNSLSMNNQSEIIQVTPSQLIQIMAQLIAQKTTNGNAAALTDLGEYAFSSLTNNSILRAIEAAFSAMAEDRATDSTRGDINSSIAQSLSQTWAQLKKVKGVDQFQQAFNEVLNACYRLIYNLNIPLAHPSADGSSTDGGFQLYQRIHDHPTAIGTRIETPDQLREMILYAVNKIANDLGQTYDVKIIANRLQTVINTDDFLKQVLWNYDDQNKQESDPVQNYAKLSRTPMQSCDGDNPYEVDDVDTGTTYDNNVQVYMPKDPYDLISWCLGLAKFASAEMVPMDSPQHAFNFVPANPDLVQYIQNGGGDAAQWIRKTLVMPGMQVAKRKISADTQQALSQGMLNIISNNIDNQAYGQLVQSLSQQTLSLQDYSQRLLNGIHSLLKSNAEQEDQLALTFDGVLFQSLSLQDQALLEESAIRFAFTNWNEGTKDIYFCAFFNPRTTQVGFGRIFEDKTNLQPMDEKAWVDNQQWDVDLSPASPQSMAMEKKA